MPTNLQGIVAPIIPAGTKSPITLQSPQKLRGSPTSPQTAQAVATDLDNLARQVNDLNTAAQTSPPIKQIFIVNTAGQVVAAFGTVEYEGVPFVNFVSELHAGTPQQANNPNDAIFNANDDGSVSIGNNGWLDVHDEFDGNAAWIGTQNDTTVITNAVNNGSGEIRLTVPGHTLITGNTATVRVMNLYNVPNANGTWPVTVIDASTVDLDGSIWSGPFQPITNPPAGLTTYQPTIDRVLQVTGCVASGGLIKVQTSIAHTYETGDRVNIPAIPGVSVATGQWTIKVVDATNFTLDGSTFSGAFSGNGTCLRFFAGVLAQTFATGPSFQNYNLRAFADGSLRIRNASIVLSSAGSTIVLDPTGPTITLTSPSGQIVLNATTEQIVLTTTANSAKIVLDATVPNIKMYDSTGTLSVTIDSNGTVTARNVNSTTGFSGTATVRNAAGTGTSSFVFNNGVCASFTP